MNKVKKYQTIKNFHLVLDYFGSIENLADELGITAPSIYDWYRRRFTPAKRAYQIEILTKGKIPASKLLPSGSRKVHPKP